MKRIITFLITFITITISAQTLQFNKSVTIEVTSNEGDKVPFEYFFSTNQKDLSCMKVDPSTMEDSGEAAGEIYMVFSKKQNIVYMNMMGMKMKKSIGKTDMMQYNNYDKIDTANITQTGKTKRVLGYLCYEYLAKTKEATTHVWATTASFPITGTFIPILGMRNESKVIKGFVLEIVLKSKNGNGRVAVTEINKNAKLVINTSEYKSMGF
ncbi:DUF4412 domain-containing protein [Tenacibaculum halocynthiae]|uniref:DUF4412 domain-containing protein n=1 Tax=Tenacibaculum halocynthiae TaxID=1254437 RepID=UPI00389644CD